MGSDERCRTRHRRTTLWWTLHLSRNIWSTRTYSRKGYTRLPVNRHRCGRGSVSPTVRQRTRHPSSSGIVLRSQCHQCVGMLLLMCPLTVKELYYQVVYRDYRCNDNGEESTPSKLESKLERVYFDPERVGSYGGANALRRVTHVPKKVVEQWLSGHDAHTLHKPLIT